MDASAPLTEINWSGGAVWPQGILRFPGGSNVQSSGVEKNHCARNHRKTSRSLVIMIDFMDTKR